MKIRKKQINKERKRQDGKRQEDLKIQSKQKKRFFCEKNDSISRKKGAALILAILVRLFFAEKINSNSIKKFASSKQKIQRPISIFKNAFRLKQRESIS
jgi:hypothetical protein